MIARHRIFALTGFAALTMAAAVDAQLAGNAERGEAYFRDGYKCYACHGFDAQTGARRLRPMNYNQAGFIAFVQNSPLPQMPAFPDMPAQALADVYAYIQTIPVDAPDIEDVPLLQDVLNRTRDAFDE